MTNRWHISLYCLVGMLFIGGFSASLRAEELPPMPRIVGDWWQVAGSPDLGELTSEHQQPVDFAVWQAADGTWQLQSCIRDTKIGDKRRLFHRWEGAKLTDANWKPMGIVMRADPKLGETPGGLQAPYVFNTDGLYWMFYGDWMNICSATSMDGKVFERRIQADQKTGLFHEPALTLNGSGNDGNNARDPMVIRIGDLWYCYYSANPEKGRGAVYCRTSPDLKTWSESRIVARGGKSGDGHGSSECPFVVELSPGNYYLFRNQSYGGKGGNTVYFSHDPMDFGIDHDEGHFVCTLPVAAPEIIKHEGQYYIAALLPDLKGIRIARLEWSTTK